MNFSLPYDKEAYQLLHEGSIALAQVEHNGIRVDTNYLDQTMRRMDHRIDRIKSRMDSSEVASIWRNHYKGRTNLGSNVQLGYVLFEKMGFDCPELTATKRFKTDEKTLGTVNHPFVKDYLKVRKLEKSRNTFLEGIKREVVDGFIHPVFNLHIVKTFRSSSDSPNFQNIPIRDPAVAKLIRQAFIARPGCRLVELDYSGIEVSIAACYHKDPRMLEYLEDETKDMHRDMAMECFKLPPEEMETDGSFEDSKRIKAIRHAGKNGFVFPQFYGDWFVDCARHLWNTIDDTNLHFRDGTSIFTHLEDHGITSLGDIDGGKPTAHSFLAHIQKVEKDFWENRFRVYNKWRRSWVKRYMERGWMLTKTGFICQGHLKRNEIIN